MKRYNLSGFEVLEYEEAGSTNTLALSLRRADLKDKSVVLTFRQTQGRGQVGNTWESEPGKNISMTVVFRPLRVEAARQFAVSMVIALGVRDFVSRYTAGCSVKWPNDIYVGDKKIAGILIEHDIAGRFLGLSVCGIGLNVNQRQFLSDAPNPVSLWQLTGTEMPLEEALEKLLACIGRRYGQVAEYETLETDFLKALYRREGVYDWQDEKGCFRASVEGVDEYGRLRLKDTAGVERVYGFKEVVYK